MTRGWHYVRPAKRVSAPVSVFAVHLWPFRSARVGIEGYQTDEWGAADVIHYVRRRDRWRTSGVVKVTTPESLREYMDGCALKGATNWVIARSCTDVLTLSKWWDYAKRQGVRIEDGDSARPLSVTDRDGGGRISVSVLCCSGPPDIVGYTESGVRWRWVSARNYWPDGPADDGGQSDDGGAEPESRGAHGGRGGGQSGDGATGLARRFVRLCDWWRGVATSRFAPTASGLAYGVLRSHLPAKGLLVHKCADAHRLERQCATGGRASVWYFGRIGERPSARPDGDGAAGALLERAVPGPVYSLDVQSMYPSLLRDQSFPVALGYGYANLTVRALLDMCRSGGVLARVTVRTLVPEYPRRTDAGIRYPVGKWVACLAGPEILALADTPGHGEILECHAAYTYRMGAPFRSSMEALLEAREQATDGADEQFAKLLSNSLAGRLAMRAGKWKRWPKLDGYREWGEEWCASTGSVNHARYRWIFGVCYAHDPEHEPAGPHTACFAYLTAYARVRMAQIRALCPVKSVYAQHTDGLYCSGAALRSLTDAGTLSGTGAGALRAKGVADSAQFWGAAHYRFGRKWVLSGYPLASVDEENGRVRITRRPGLFGERHRDAPTSVRTQRLTISLPVESDGCEIGADGWALPARAVNRKRRSEDR